MQKVYENIRESRLFLISSLPNDFPYVKRGEKKCGTFLDDTDKNMVYNVTSTLTIVKFMLKSKFKIQAFI